MRRRFRQTTLALGVLAWLNVGNLRAQEPTDTVRPAPPGADSVPADTARKKTLGELPIYITGYVTGAYTYSFANTGNALVGRFYERYHDQIMMNALRLGIEEIAATDKVDAGVRFELLFGQDAAVTKAGGLDLGPNSDLTEAYVTLNLPLGDEHHFMQLKGGKMWTIMGYEVIDDVLDPNLSVGNQFVYLENFTNMAVGADFKLGPLFDAQLRLMNGWDVVQDNNTDKSFMARVGFTPGPAFTLGVLGYWGPEQADNTDDTRKGVEVLATLKPVAGTTIVGQFDYGSESFGDADASWWGVGVWLLHDFSSRAQVAIRGDYVKDEDGVRSSGVLGYPLAPSRAFGSGTITLNYRVTPKVLFRPEFRIDFSDRDDYGDPAGDGSGRNTERTQPSVRVGASYQF